MKPWFTFADVVTALRLPLAVLFPFLRPPAAQLAVVAVAAASDFFDGILARRFGGSRVGPFTYLGQSNTTRSRPMAETM